MTDPAALPEPMSDEHADWLWSQLMDWCKAHGMAPAMHNALFAIVGRFRTRLLAALDAATARAEEAEKERSRLYQAKRDKEDRATAAEADAARLREALVRIKLMECYTREGEEEPHLRMMRIAADALAPTPPATVAPKMCRACQGSGKTPMATDLLLRDPAEQRKIDQMAADNPVTCWRCNGTGLDAPDPRQPPATVAPEGPSEAAYPAPSEEARKVAENILYLILTPQEPKPLDYSTDMLARALDRLAGRGRA